ncbi:hypothetical protein KEU06_24000 [Pseudaminobacter sp. 19-2017]|uniref:Uncharacterized protein n=1 Tax=Pseudaminobacter soli (ex Zhang et al. 2022) TaxID=2831468 RepID=A0A942E671_9HYPH|nr:hypothetical protein [Pseudaminobacter soli]MBS3651686.1 hypothetical protein [Pseudaminobacter soli]
MQMFSIGVAVERRQPCRPLRAFAASARCLPTNNQNAVTNVAFAFATVENGENPQSMSEKIDTLAASVNRFRRLRSLEHEAHFIEATRQQLALVLSARDRR